MDIYTFLGHNQIDASYRYIYTHTNGCTCKHSELLCLGWHFIAFYESNWSLVNYIMLGSFLVETMRIKLKVGNMQKAS